MALLLRSAQLKVTTRAGSVSRCRAKVHRRGDRGCTRGLILRCQPAGQFEYSGKSATQGTHLNRQRADRISLKRGLLANDPSWLVSAALNQPFRND